MVGSGTGSRVDAEGRPWEPRRDHRLSVTAAGPWEAQPWLARAFFLRFASLRFRFTDGFS
jgi:hypothetical protein